MSNSFEDAVQRERQRQDAEVSARAGAAATRAATEKRLITEVLGAAQDFRDYMVRRNVPTQPLHVFVDYRDYSVHSTKRASFEDGTEMVDSRHVGWRPLRQRYISGTRDFAGYVTVDPGLFVTRDALVVQVNSIDQPAEIAARTPAIHTLLWPHREKPEWVQQGQPAPIEEFQQAAIDGAVFSGDPPQLINEWGWAKDDFVQSAIKRVDLITNLAIFLPKK